MGDANERTGAGFRRVGTAWLCVEWMQGCCGLAWRGRYVLHVTDHRKHHPLFTERYNGQNGVAKRRFVHIGPYCIRGPRRVAGRA